MAISFFMSGCGIYSFNGTNIDPAVRTISISTIQNNTPAGPAFLTQRFTEDLKDYFQRNTNLKLVPRDGDLQFDGNIVAYDFAPAAIQQVNGVSQAGSNRLTIQVKIRFTNTKDDKQSFEQVFQNYDDYAATATSPPSTTTPPPCAPPRTKSSPTSSTSRWPTGEGQQKGQPSKGHSLCAQHGLELLLFLPGSEG